MFCGISKGLKSLNTVQKIFISNFIFFQSILDHLNIHLIVLELLTENLFILVETSHTNKKQSLDKTLEKVVDIDGPEGRLLVDGHI